jgi:hypothetical protein
MTGSCREVHSVSPNRAVAMTATEPVRAASRSSLSVISLRVQQARNGARQVPDSRRVTDESGAADTGFRAAVA